jgi:hypothetical protein
MRLQVLSAFGSCTLVSGTGGVPTLNRSFFPSTRFRMSTRLSTMSSARWAQAFSISPSLPMALSMKVSNSPTMVAFRCPTSTMTMVSPRFDAAVLSCCLTRCSVGRRLMRAAAMVGGAGISPIRLMPRLTQVRNSPTLSLAFFSTMLMMSRNTSTSAMMLPTMGRLPSTIVSRSSVT